MGRHRRRRGHARTGLIGASAALAVGAVAVGTGLLPGIGDSLKLTENDDVQAQDQRSRTERPASPTPEPEPTAAEKPEEKSPEPSAEPSPPETEEPTQDPAPEPSPEPEPTDPPAQDTETPRPEPTEPAPPPSEEPEPSPEPDTTEAGAVLSLVNEERSRAGCAPLGLDPALNALSADHSKDMAERGYFDHTDPDGRTPWDRAAEAGVDNLGGENIARGQQSAQAVMDSWMSSEGHRANILNCDFTTLGLGVHHADGGPWWTQTFGF